jgi:hypothetical protein
MKDKKIQKELDELKEMMKYVICQVQNMQSRIDQLDQDTMLWLSKHDDRSGRQSDRQRSP